MLPADIIINNIQPTPFGWFPPTIAGVTALGVAWLAAWSLKKSDERKKAQEDRRRWDEELVKAVVAMLVITDDVAATEKEVRKKKKTIFAGDLPGELNRLLIQIRLLTNEHLADQAQHVVTHFLTERIAMNKLLTTAVAEGNKLDDIAELPGYDFGSTISESYHESRRYFLNLFHQLLVSTEVQKFTAQSSVNWKAMVKLVDEAENEMKRQEEEPKHRKPDEPIPATAVRGRIN
ncbi:hypothetical protein [Arthrobacter sp. fls2-241-R2A-172]|uniref:hypothetical protein n=1 Tax=Arthrobacter sp. fls2-241-R2A-172 TaxID=3040325 RepID=UPI0025502A0F|nr:hypothetical protein [Arthrobacter sp. fls2-241-R2A-172]